MENEITPEQKAQLKTWAGQRDKALLEISALRTEQEKLVEANKKLSESSAEIEARLNQNLGKIEELKNRESELFPTIKRDIATQLSQKAVLETNVSDLQKLVAELESRKISLETSISFLTDTFKSLNERVGLLDKVVGHVTAVSDQNVTIISNLVDSVKESLQSVIDLNLANVEKTNVVIKELPKVFLEARRQSLVRQVINEPKR